MTGRPSLKSRLFQALAEGQLLEFKRTPISADLIRTVVLGHGAPPELAQLRTVSQAALRIRGAMIEGRLDLSHMSGPGGGVLPALCFEDCRFEGGISIEGSSFAALILKDCRFQSIDDDQPTVDLSRALVANDVTLTGAQPGEEGGICWIAANNAVIDGNLTLEGGQFRSPPARAQLPITGIARYAVMLRGTEIKGRLTCVGDVLADGGITIVDARVCSDAWFSGTYAIAHEGSAFNGQSAVIDGSLMLDARPDIDGDDMLRPFRAQGDVFLLGIKVGGALHCSHIRIHNPEGASLVLNDAEIGKKLVIEGDKASQHGRARLLGTIHLENAKIGGALSIASVNLGAKSGLAIVANNMHCDRSVAVLDAMPLRRVWLGQDTSRQFLAAGKVAEDEFDRSFDRDVFARYLMNAINFSEARVGNFYVGGGAIIYGGIGAVSMRCVGDCEIRTVCIGDITLNSINVETGSMRLDGLTLTPLGNERGRLSLRDAEVRRSIETRRQAIAGAPAPTANAIRLKPLDCLPGYSLIEVLWSGSGQRMSGHLVRDGGQDSIWQRMVGQRARPKVINLGGSSQIFHDLYREGAMTVSPGNAEELLRLFCNYLQGTEDKIGNLSNFRIIEPNDPFPEGIKAEPQIAASLLATIRSQMDEVRAAGGEDVESRLHALETEAAFAATLADPELTEEALVAALRHRIEAVRMSVRDGRHNAHACMIYGNILFRVELSLDPESSRSVGLSIEMIGDAEVTPELNIPLRFDGRVISSPSATSWPLGPCLPGMRNLEGDELERMRAIMRDHHPDIAEFSGAIVDLEDAQCDTLRDGGGRDWGATVQLRLDRFTYRHADDADPLLVTDRSWFEKLKQKLGLTKDLTVRSRLEWLMQSYQPRSEGRPTAQQLRDNYCPQPFEQLIQVARASGNEAMATTIEIEKAKIEAGRFTARMRGLLAGAGAVGAGLWAVVHGVSGVLDAVFLASIFLFVTFLFDLGNLGIRAMFGYLRRPVNTVITLAFWIAVGSLGVHIANSRGQLVVDVVPTASGLEPAKGRYATPVIEGRAFDAVPCGTEINEVLYAADVFIPLIDLRQESRCTVGESSLAAVAVPLTGEAGWWARQAADIRARTVDSRTFWEVLKAVYSVLGWLILSLAILTFARIDRRVQEP